MMILVFGGSGSGKSAYAEKRIMELSGGKKTVYYLATMQVYGEEGRKKVRRHHELRRDKGMLTLERPRDVAEVIPKLTAEENKRGEGNDVARGGVCVLLEDLGNLVANEMFLEDGIMIPKEAVAEKILTQVRVLCGAVSHLVIVSNNVFEDGIAYDEGTHDYVLALGSLHEALAREAAEVVEVVAGIPVFIKGGQRRTEQ